MMMTDQIHEFVMESAWQRKRRIKRMMAFDKRTGTGVVQPDRTWHVAALVSGVVLLNAVLFVRLWL